MLEQLPTVFLQGVEIINNTAQPREQGSLLDVPDPLDSLGASLSSLFGYLFGLHLINLLFERPVRARLDAKDDASSIEGVSQARGHARRLCRQGER
jgi:hypothetical protein